MSSDGWMVVLAVALGLSAVLGFGYRVYRLSQGGPIGDVLGQAVLGVVLVGLAAALVAEMGWARWAALIYGLLFGVVVMPIWVLAVLIPSDPQRIDYAFTATYWTALLLIVIAAVLS